MKAGEIAAFLNAEIVGNAEIDIERVASIDSAGAHDLTFLERGDLPPTAAGCIIARVDDCAPNSTIIRSSDPKLDFARAAALLHPPKKRGPEIHPSSIISPTAEIGAGVFIGAFTCIGDGSVVGNGTHLRAGAKLGDNVHVGQNCVLHPNVFVEDGCTIGSNVILHTGVVIGTPGFGYVRDVQGEYHQFPQIGTVVIEDNVEIGANSCVDRGALAETRIGAGTKIDNLVQIAHNVQIGKRVIIAAQTGISGSTVIEDDCVIGGQVGMGDHARVQSGAVIGSQAGVLPGKIVRPGVWWGTPVQPLDEYKIQNAHIKAISRFRKEFAELRKIVQRLEKDHEK